MPAPLYSRDDLLRVYAHGGERLARWAADRLDDDALVALLAASNGDAAQPAAVAAHAACRAPSPDAVRDAWRTADARWRPALAELAARAGWAPAAQEWAARAAETEAAEWASVAVGLLPLDPAALTAAAETLRAGGERNRGTGLVAIAATSPATLPVAVHTAWSGSAAAHDILGRSLLVAGAAAAIREALGARAQPGGAGAALQRVLRPWSGSAPAPWELVPDVAGPARDIASCRAALGRLLGSLPAGTAGEASAGVAFVDDARRRCLTELAEGGGWRVVDALSGRVRREDIFASVWALAVALYAAACHPLDWWRPLATGGGLADVPGLPPALAQRAWGERDLAALSCVYGDPPPWYPRLAAADTEAFVQAWVGAVQGLRSGDAVPDAAPPGVPADRLLSWGARAADAALARQDALLPASAVLPLLARGDGTPVEEDLIRLARRLPPAAAPECRAAVAAGPTPPEGGSGRQEPAAVEAQAAQRRRQAGLFFLGAMPWAEAGTELAAVVAQLMTDREFWPPAAQTALGTAAPEAVRAVLALWRPGDWEIGDGLLLAAEVLDALGRPGPEGIGAVRADLPPGGRRWPPPDSGPEDLAGVGPDGPAEAAGGEGREDGDRGWPLRAALQCVACGRIHVYDVRKINVFADPGADGAAAGSAPALAEAASLLPPGVRWGRANPSARADRVDLVADVVPAPRFLCRSCGAAGRCRPAVTAAWAMRSALAAWQRLRAAGPSAPEPGAPGPGRGAPDRRDRVEVVEAMRWGPLLVSKKDMIDVAEANVAAGRSEPADLQFLASQWLAMGDPEAARMFVGRAQAAGAAGPHVHFVLARLADADGDRQGAVGHLRSALALAERPGGDPEAAAVARRALRVRAAGAPAGPAAPAARLDVVGRNDPCPCGSGKKYKRCCGAGT